jgi:hypothetical protein
MNIDKHNPSQQRQQPLPLSALLDLSTGDLSLPVRSMPKSRRDRKEQRAFLRSILEQAIEIANDLADCFPEDMEESSSSDNTDGEEDNSHSQNQNQ